MVLNLSKSQLVVEVTCAHLSGLVKILNVAFLIFALFFLFVVVVVGGGGFVVVFWGDLRNDSKKSSERPPDCFKRSLSVIMIKPDNYGFKSSTLMKIFYYYRHYIRVIPGDA